VEAFKIFRVYISGCENCHVLVYCGAWVQIYWRGALAPRGRPGVLFSFLTSFSKHLVSCRVPTVAGLRFVEVSIPESSHGAD